MFGTGMFGMTFATALRLGTLMPTLVHADTPTALTQPPTPGSAFTADGLAIEATTTAAAGITVVKIRLIRIAIILSKRTVL